MCKVNKQNRVFFVFRRRRFFSLRGMPLFQRAARPSAPGMYACSGGRRKYCRERKNFKARNSTYLRRSFSFRPCSFSDLRTAVVRDAGKSRSCGPAVPSLPDGGTAGGTQNNLWPGRTVLSRAPRPGMWCIGGQAGAMTMCRKGLPLPFRWRRVPFRRWRRRSGGGRGWWWN